MGCEVISPCPVTGPVSQAKAAAAELAPGFETELSAILREGKAESDQYLQDGKGVYLRIREPRNLPRVSQQRAG